MKRIFITFANSRMIPSLNRIKKQAELMGCFDRIVVMSDKDLDEDFKHKYRERLKKGTRGYGYWIWKPYIILNELKKMQEGDELLYVDAGCHLNPSGRTRLDEYFAAVAQGEIKVGGFKLSDKHNEKRWTKMDLLIQMNVLKKQEILETGQIEGGHVILKKCDNSISLIEDWFSISQQMNLIDDSPSVAPNYPEFKEHRHDQSVFSLLCKMRGAVEFSASEVYPDDEVSWDKLHDCPIHDRRDKQFCWGTRFRNKLNQKIGKLLRFLRLKS